MSDYPSSGTQAVEQLPLFDNPQAPTPAKSRQVSKQTKRTAFKASQSGSAQQRELVLQCIRDAGSVGITRKEIAERYEGIEIPSVCGRVNELIKEIPCRVFQRGKRNRSAILFAKGFA